VTFLLITAAAGSLGALARYLITGWVQRWTQSLLPVGTAAVNLLGALFLGIAVGAMDIDSMATIAVVGFLAGLTTFSTWMVETVSLAAEPVYQMKAAMNILIPLAAGVALATLGYYLAS